MHIAETKEKAMADVRFGLEKWLFYFREIANLPIVPAGDGDPVEAFLKMPMAVVGTPDDAAAKIQALVDQSGGFGAFLFMAHNWANWTATKQSYELFARYVAPKFQSLNVGRDASMAWVKENKSAFTAQSMMAVGDRIRRHAEEKGADNINPAIAAMMGIGKKEPAAE
jgi:limonene 1,2-monooxygenase